MWLESADMSIPPVLRQPPAPSVPGTLPGMLRGILLAAAVVVGLLLMHGLNLHGTAPAHEAHPFTAAGQVAQTPAATENQHLLADTSAVGCAECQKSGDQQVVSAACVAALLLLFLTLGVLPAFWARRIGFCRAGPGYRLRARRFRPSPSLHALCISRT